MPTAISTLRVELDASGYVASGNAVDDANKKMAASTERLGTNVEQTERRLTVGATGFEKLQRSIDPAYGALQKFEAAQRKIQAALAEGETTQQRAGELTGILAQKFERVITAANGNSSALTQASSVAKAYAQSISGITTLQNALTVSLEGTSEAVKKAYASSVQPIDATAAAIGRVYQASLLAGKADRELAQARLAVAEAYNKSITPINGVASSVAAAYNASLKAGQADREALASRLAVAEAYNKSINPTVHLTNAQEELSKSSVRGEISSRALSGAVKNFGFQVGDVATSLASGANPFVVVAQQADQFRVAFTQGGGVSAVLAGFRAQLAALITPTTAAVVGITALAGAVALLALRSGTIDQQTKQFNLALDAMHTSALVNTTDFTKMANELRSVGVSADDARKAMLEIARTEGINPAFAKQIVEVGANISAVFGGEAVDRAKELTTAIAGGIEPTIKFGLELKAFDPVQAQVFRNMALGGKATEATNQAFNLISATMDGKARAAMSNTARAIADLRSAWSTMIDSLAKSKPIQDIVKDLTDLLNIIDKLANKQLKLEDIIKIGPVADTIRELKDIGQFIDRNLPGGKRSDATGATGTAVSPTGGLNTYGSPGGVASSNTFDTRGLNVSSPDLQRLTQVLEQAVKWLPEGYSAVATSTIADRASGTANHPAGRAIDVNVVGPEGVVKGSAGNAKGEDVTGLYTQLAGAAYLENKRLFGDAPLGWGGRFGTVPGGTVKDLMHFDTSGDRGSLDPRPLSEIAAALTKTDETLPKVADATKGIQDGAIKTGAALGVAQGASDASGPATGRGLDSDIDKLKEKKEQYDRLNEANKLYGDEQLRARTKEEAYNNSQLKNNERNRDAEQQATQAVTAHGIELQKASALEQLRTKIQLDAAAAGDDEVKRQQILAAGEGQLAKLRGEASNAGAKRDEVLRAGSTQATESLAQQLPALSEAQKATIALTDAAKQGTQQEHDAAVQNQITAQTLGAINAAKSAGKDVTTEAAKAIANQTAVQIKLNDTLQQNLTIQRNINANKDRQAVVELDTRLQGQTSEEIQRQVHLLQEAQDLRRRGVDLATEGAQAELKSVDNLERANIKRNEAVRQQQRIDDGIRQIGDSIASNIGQSLEDAFSGQKIEDWGKKLRSMLAQLASQIATSFIIKPIIGDVISSLGFKSAAQGFGSLFGSSDNGAATVKTNPDGSLNVVLQAGGLAKDTGLFGDLFGGSGGLKDIFGGLKTSIDNFGASAFGLGGGVDFGGGGAALGVADAVEGGTGLLGGLGLSSILGGVGLIGGVAGLLGLFDGLFGGKKPDLASAASFDFGSQQFGGVQSHGVQANDQSTQAITQALAEFTNTIKSLTGGTIPGGITVATGSRRGIVINGNIGDLGGEARFSQGDTAGAIKFLKLSIAHELEGVSDVVKNVLGQVTNPDELESAIAFATAYDKLQTAAESAFSEVEKDTNTIGPFATAMGQVTTIFDNLRQNAEKFGLSLDPVNAGLAEATKRLQGDFTKALEQTEFSASGRGYLSQIIDLEKAATARLKEAQSIGLGGDDRTLTLLDRTNKFGIMDVLKGLSADQLKDVVDHFKGLDDTVVELASSIKDAAKAVDGAADAFYAAAQKEFLNASGRNYINTINDAELHRQDQEKQALALGFVKGSREIKLLDDTKWATIKGALDSLNADQLSDVISYYKDTDKSISDLAQTVKDQKQAQTDLGDATQRATDLLRAQANIQTYLNNLNAGLAGDNTVSPEKKLAEAQSQYQDTLVKAQGGNIDALNDVTSKADNYIKAITQFYASTAPGQDLISSIKDALSNLAGNKDLKAANDNNSIADQIQKQTDAYKAAADQVTAAVSSSIVPLEPAIHVAASNNATAIIAELQYLAEKIDVLIRVCIDEGDASIRQRNDITSLLHAIDSDIRLRNAA